MSVQRLMVICAHPDDEVLGCGGLVCRLVDEGWSAARVIMTRGVEGRHEAGSGEARAAQESLAREMAAAGEVLGFSRTYQLDHPDNRMDTVGRMDLARSLTPLLAEVEPSLVLTQHPGDYNWDHTRTFDAVMMAARANPPDVHPTEIRTFEVPSSTERAWQSADRAFHPNIWVDISASLEAKKEALRCYASEMRSFPHPRSPEAVEHLARCRGAEVGLGAAEAFHLVRRII